MFFKGFSAHFASSKAWIRPSAGLLAAFGLALMLAFLSLPALSRTVLDLDADKQPVALADWGDYWIDPQSRLAVDQVVSQH
ncbi:MAG: hypothetical protein Q8Q74_22260, partial [Polaromonas sp.]|nr:hypothetical protein [Polaromonas sp.]